MRHITKLLTLFLLLPALVCPAQFDPTGIGVVITNEAVINSQKLEYSPTFYQDGIVFISTQSEDNRYRVKDKRIGTNIMSIYWAKRDAEGLLTKPIPFATELLSKIHEGPLTFDRTGQVMFFSRNNLENGKKKAAKDGIVKMKIYQASKKNDRWGQIVPLPFNHDESNTMHPSLSVDDDRLYFASDRPGGYGKMDLYVVERYGKNWGPPRNLGPEVNTEGNEAFPFIHADGTLYFASDTHEGLGGYDLFYALPTDSSFARPVNLGDPFNSKQDDLAIILDRDQKNGYFSSNRKSGTGQDDIYSFYITGNKGIVKRPQELIAEEEQELRIWLQVSEKLSHMHLSEALVVGMDMTKLSPSRIITGPSGTIATLLPVGEAKDKMILQLAVEESDVGGLTDRDGRIPLKLTGNRYVINVTKEGFKTTQLVLSDYAEGDEIEVFLERASDCVPFKGQAKDEFGNPLAGATVIIRDENGVIKDEIITDRNGHYDYCLKKNKYYYITVMYEGKVVAERQIISSDPATEANPLALITQIGTDAMPLKKGLTIELPNIYYNFNDASIRPDAKKDLDVVVAILNQYPHMEIELNSHTDSRGTHEYNDQLSQKRAENAVQYLLENGIGFDRVTAKGLGETAIRNKCKDGVRCSERDHQFNRRTEIKVTKFDLPEARVEFVQTKAEPEEINVVPPPVLTNKGPADSKIGGRRVLDADESSYYLVIAGTYEQESNARRRLATVQGLGYEAEIGEFDRSGLQSVVVGTFGNPKDAKQLVDTLRSDHQIHSYIKRMRN